MKVIIVDFNDSFTWNIFSTLKEMDEKLEIEVVHWQEFDNSKTKDTVVILGPGPGHPDEYFKIYPKIRELMKKKDTFLMGICLGHQLLAKVMGLEIVSSASLVHGQTEQITLPAWTDVFSKEMQNKQIEVQRYNSLSVKDDSDAISEVKTLVKKGEIVMMKFGNGVSYQFHPESVGTSCPKSFFEVALKFLYNRGDERSTQNHRSI